MITDTATIPYTIGLQSKQVSRTKKRMSKRDEAILSELNKRVEREEAGKTIYYSLEESRELLRESEQRWTNTK